MRCERRADILDVGLGSLLRDCALFVHGATIATNTVLEEKGAKVGLLTTEGFRDSPGDSSRLSCQSFRSPHAVSPRVGSAQSAASRDGTDSIAREMRFWNSPSMT